MKKWIREWLGIDQIYGNLSDMCENDLARHRQLNRIEAQLSTITPGLRRIIAKLDTNYAKDELDPTKRAESDRLAAKTIRRLEGEALARAPYNIGRDD